LNAIIGFFPRLHRRFGEGRPVMTTAIPVRALVGENRVIVRAAANVNDAAVLAVPPGVVTAIVRAGAACK
jgi:hypothetical protein